MMENTVTRSALMEVLRDKYNELPYEDIEEATKLVLARMTTALEQGERIEIRGFGTFSLHHYKPREARNPKTGKKVVLDKTSSPHFKVGKELRERVNKKKVAAAAG